MFLIMILWMIARDAKKSVKEWWEEELVEVLIMSEIKGPRAILIIPVALPFALIVSLGSLAGGLFHCLYSSGENPG